MDSLLQLSRGKITVDQGSAHSAQGPELALLPVIISTVLLEHSHPRGLAYYRAVLVPWKQDLVAETGTVWSKET